MTKTSPLYMVLSFDGFVDLLRESLHINQSVSEVVASGTLFAVIIITGWLVYSFFALTLNRWAKKTKTKLDDALLQTIRTPIILFFLLLGAFLAIQPLSFLKQYSAFFTSMFFIINVFAIMFILTRVITVLVDWYVERTKSKRRMSPHVLYILKKAIQGFIFILAFLTILVVFNINLSSVVVGLGVGGIAIALAIQNILGDAFSALTIYFDRPFEIGDFIVVGDYSGTVKKIGIRSTRIQLLQGEELVISNRQLVTTNIRNFRKLRKRRIALKLGVKCDTPIHKLKKISKIITDIIERMELAELNMIHFTEFGSYSLNFEVVYYLNTANYLKYRDTQQEINYSILEAFEKEGIELAFPTQTILINQ